MTCILIKWGVCHKTNKNDDGVTERVRENFFNEISSKINHLPKKENCKALILLTQKSHCHFS